MKTAWQWLNAPVAYVGLSDAIVALVCGGAIGSAVGSLVRWAIA